MSVTVSTSGVLPGLKRFLAESKASLALSLNATTDEVRAQVMPHNKTWPIAALLGALATDAARRGSPRRPSSSTCSSTASTTPTPTPTAWWRCSPSMPARVNLIPYNPYPGTPLRTPPARREWPRFHERVVRQGQLCLVRWPRGREIAAACGQLVRSTGGAGFEPSARVAPSS